MPFTPTETVRRAAPSSLGQQEVKGPLKDISKVVIVEVLDVISAGRTK